MTQTPYYVFDHLAISEAFAGISRDLGGMPIYFCLKANGEQPIAETLQKAGALFEVSSQGEWETAVSVGAKPEDIICGVPVKPRSLIHSLYQAGCRYFVFDCLEEYAKLIDEAPEAEKILRLYIADISIDSIPFGAKEKEVCDWIQSGALDPQAVSGITFDTRKNKDIEVTLRALNYIERILGYWPGNKLKLVNIGGNYRSSPEIGTEYYRRLTQKIASLRNRFDLKFVCELGRSLVKYSGRLYTTVVLVKKNGTSFDVFIDASVPTGITHEPTEIRVISGTPHLAQDKIQCNFFGVTCCRTKLFQWNLEFIPSEGLVLEMLGMGAYTICKSSSFHGLARPSVFHENRGTPC